MPEYVVNGAALKCSQGLAPSVLIVLPVNPMSIMGQPVGTIMDFKPIVNIPTFGMCNSTSNPAVMATTAAAQGVHTPAPCLPATAAAWSPGASKSTQTKLKALTKDSTCKCAYNATIEITNSGQKKGTTK